MAGKNGKIKRDQQVVVLEDINSKFSLILEQFSGVNKKIDNNHKEFLEFKDEMLEFKGEMFEFRDRTDKNLKVALEYLFRIDEEIQDIKSEITDLKKRLKEKADQDRILDVEKRMVKLEKLVFAKLR